MGGIDSNAVSKCKDFVTHISRSKNAAENFRSCQQTVIDKAERMRKAKEEEEREQMEVAPVASSLNNPIVQHT